MMEAADQSSSGQLTHDVFQAVISVAGRGSVVKGQQQTRERLDQEQKYSHTAEHLVPAAGSWNIFEQEVLHGALQARAMFDPIDDPPLQRFHKASSPDC